MRCLITGATGFLGSHFVARLLKEGWEVAILARPGSTFWRLGEVLPSVQVLWGSLENAPQLASQIHSFHPEVVLHSGWAGVVKGERDHFDQVKINLYGSLSLLRVCLENGCNTWIGIGSQAEYGPTNDALDEERIPQPDHLYGLAKLCVGLQSQQMCLQAGARAVWLRLTAAYGPKDDPDHLIPYTIATLLNRDEPALTSGEQRWDYLFIDDVTQAVWQAIENPAVAGIYNLSSGKSFAVRKICEFIRDQIDVRLPLGFGKIASSENARQELLARNDRLRQASGWEPSIDLDEGIRRTIDWYVAEKARSNLISPGRGR